MDSQVADSPQAPTISVHTLQQLFKICDDVAAQLRNGAPYLVVPFESLLPLGDHAFEVLKDRLEATTNTRFAIGNDGAGGQVIFSAVAPMPSGSPAESAAAQELVSVGTPGSENAKSANMKKAPRPKNAFMIYRLDYHAIIARQNPGMHNNDISKLIGAKWRAETSLVREEYHKRAEDEKRQHAIDHPGYRYQPRKPFEKKKRMTKAKLAKLSKKSNGADTAMNAIDVPAELDVSDVLLQIEAHFGNALQGEQFAIDTYTAPFQNDFSQLSGNDTLTTVTGGENLGNFADQMALLSAQHPQMQLNADMFAPADPVYPFLFTDGDVRMPTIGETSTDVGPNLAATAASLWAEMVSGIAGLHTAHKGAGVPDPYAEQRRQEQLDADFNAFINMNNETKNVPGNFAPADSWAPVLDGESWASESFASKPRASESCVGEC